VKVLPERLGDARIDATKVKVRQMSERAHGLQ
jgi:hypothetical protein